MTLTRLSGYMFLVAFSQFACGESHFVVKSNDSQQEPIKPSVQVYSAALQRLLDSPSISPYEIANYITESAESDEEFVDFKPIWERLNNLKIEDDGLSEDEKEIFDGFKPSFTRWQVELIDSHDADDRYKQIIVKIMIYEGAYRRFLIFKPETVSQQNTGWKFCGHFDECFPKNNPDIQQFHQLFSRENGLWLIIRNGGGYGTGVLGEYEIWYKIDQEPPREVLNYSIKGVQMHSECICNAEYNSRAKTIIDNNGTLTREITYKVSFGAVYKPDFHWLLTKRCKAVYQWNQNLEKFIFDPHYSTVSEEELNNRFGSRTKADFIKYNFNALIQLAKTANSEQRAWLEEVLETLKDEAQKTQLRNALGH